MGTSFLYVLTFSMLISTCHAGFFTGLWTAVKGTATSIFSSITSGVVKNTCGFVAGFLPQPFSTATKYLCGLVESKSSRSKRSILTEDENLNVINNQTFSSRTMKNSTEYTMGHQTSLNSSEKDFSGKVDKRFQKYRKGNDPIKNGEKIENVFSGSISLSDIFYHLLTVAGKTVNNSYRFSLKRNNSILMFGISFGWADFKLLKVIVRSYDKSPSPVIEGILLFPRIQYRYILNKLNLMKRQFSSPLLKNVTTPYLHTEVANLTISITLRKSQGTFQVLDLQVKDDIQSKLKLVMTSSSQITLDPEVHNATNLVLEVAIRDTVGRHIKSAFQKAIQSVL